MDRVKAIIGMLRDLLRRAGLAELAGYGETDLLHILKQADDNLGRDPDGNGPRGGNAPTVPRMGDARSEVPRGSRTQAEAKGYVRAYRGVSQSAPFNDTETV